MAVKEKGNDESYSQSSREIANRLEKSLGIKNILPVILLTTNKGVSWKYTLETGYPTLEMKFGLCDADESLILRYTPPVNHSERTISKGIVTIHEPGSNVSDLEDISLYGRVSDNFGSVKLTEVRLGKGHLPIFLGHEERPDGKYPFYVFFYSDDEESESIPTTYSIIGARNFKEFKKDLEYFESFPQMSMDSLEGTILQDEKYLLKFIKMIVPEALIDSLS